MSCCLACEQMESMGAIAGVDAGVCGAGLFQLATPGTVETLKLAIHQQFELTDTGARACPSLPAIERSAWETMFRDWRLFRAEDVGFMNAGSQWNATCAWSARLDAEREKLAKLCGSLPGPERVEPPKSEVGQVLKFVAVAAVAVAVAVVVNNVVQFIPTKRRR